MSNNTEALRLAAWLTEGAFFKMKLGDVESAGRELRRLHARVLELEEAALSPAPASTPGDAADTDETTRDEYRRMFMAACNDLGAVNEALSLNPDDGGADPILAAIAELKAGRASTPVAAEGGTLDREALVDLIAEHLSGTYHCGRVWSAWSVGTMSEDDFSDVGESDTPGEVADAILSHLAASPAASDADGWIRPADRLPSPWEEVIVATSCGKVTTGAHSPNVGWYWDECDDEEADALVAAWQPKPEPPRAAMAAPGAAT